MSFTSMHLSQIPLMVWGWIALGMLISTSAAFVSGYLAARISRRNSIRSAERSWKTLLTLAEEGFAGAEQLCALLEKHPLAAASESTVHQWKQRIARISESLQSYFEQRELAHQQQRLHSRRTPEPFAVSWIREPVDSAGFPDRTAFDSSLEQLLQAGNRSEHSSGLLIVKLDRIEGLRSRFGNDGANKLAKRLGGVLCRAIRDQDIVCRLEDDVFAVLLADVSDEQGRQMADVIRDSVRNHHFRIEESRDEVLVTASFGYSACNPWENAELICNRAGDALARSQKRGRNQLHAHDGQRLVACGSN